MSALPRISVNAAVELETILLTLETTQGKEAANSFMDAFLRFRPLIGLNPEKRSSKMIDDVLFYRFIHPGWNYIVYYEILDGTPIIDHFEKR